ncbi:MAG: ABC transporter substrate-binding protein [Spirochaetota bacterium]|nr:ABC transporter substrate-binding protein [Spirochaetota bacterium]
MIQEIRLGHSPDSDDAFMFYAIANDKIDTHGFRFIHVIEDIESLNKRAINRELEVSAISIHAYTRVYKDYALLSCGASIGDNYGPMVVAKSPFEANKLKGKNIAIPGELTTANLALRLFENDFNPVIIPFNQIIDAVKTDKVGAGLIIHEGQLLYEQMGLYKIIDLGEWWKDTQNLPLPLGANAIRKDLGEKNIKIIAQILKESIQYSLDHREAALDYAMKYAGDMKRILADKFVGMYVNDYTLDFGDKGREGVKRLLSMGYEKGIIKNNIPIEFF